VRIALVMIFLAASAFAQDQSAAAAAACGPKDTDFEVKLDKSKHALAPPEPGKARVYFIQDIGRVSCIGACVKTKIGMDGTWVGAVRRNSYFSISVEPGEHHMCATPGPVIALVHFTAEAGKVYYFRTRAFGGENQSIFDFDPLDSDQGQHLIASYPLSVSRPNL
jgi:Protein of unknown function (DUF2846)